MRGSFQVWVAAVQMVVGALVDAAGDRVVGVALAEGDQVPREPTLGILAEPEDEAERRRGSAFGVKRHVELATARQHCLVGTLRLTPFPVERFPASFDFPARAFGLKTGGRSLVQATHLFLPDRLTELNRDGRQILSWRNHGRRICARRNR
jgi:hypothetical protein